MYPTEIVRDFEKELWKRLAQRLPFIQIVLGPRQVGKSTGVLHIGQRLGDSFIYASADSPIPYQSGWIREQWQRARALETDAVLVLDEIQKIAGWSEVIKELFDQERRRKNPLRVVLLGSASWHIQQGITETLAGRYEVLRVPHWSLAECIELMKWDLTTYLQFGGYPAAALLIDNVSRWQQFMRDSIIEPVLARDLLTLRNVNKPALFRQTLELVCRYPAQEISLQKLLGQLQDRGNATTIKGYLELLEAGFILKILPKFSTRPLSTKSSSPKLLPLCPALIHSFEEPMRITKDPEWRGRVFESIIGAHLASSFPQLYYWRDGDDEVDFVLMLGKEPLAIEIKSGRKKRTRGLLAFKERFKKAHLLTLDESMGTRLLMAKNPREILEKML